MSLAADIANIAEKRDLQKLFRVKQEKKGEKCKRSRDGEDRIRIYNMYLIRFLKGKETEQGRKRDNG